jgi:hypothetical protein
MTALDRYVRLEAIGLWRQAPGEPPREVVVSFGYATLLLTDLEEQPLGHWALAGMVPIARENGATTYSMTADGAETLSIRDPDMVAAIAAVAPRPRPPAPPVRRRLPVGAAFAIVALCALAAAGPRLVREGVARLVPPEKAAELGDRMLITLIETHGPPCAGAEAALAGLATRLDPADPPRLRVLDLGGRAALALPGGTLVLDRATLTASPEAAAAAAARALDRDPVAALVTNAGLLADLRYLVRGDFTETALARAAAAPPPGGDPEANRPGTALPPDAPHLPSLDAAERAALAGICP